MAGKSSKPEYGEGTWASENQKVKDSMFDFAAGALKQFKTAKPKPVPTAKPKIDRSKIKQEDDPTLVKLEE